MFVATGDNVVVDEMSSEVGEPLGVLGRDDDLDALELLGGRLGHDALRAVADVHLGGFVRESPLGHRFVASLLHPQS
jgi:hypothetical protein